MIYLKSRKFNKLGLKEIDLKKFVKSIDTIEIL